MYFCRWWLVACLVPSYYLNQCWFIVNWTPGNKFHWNLNQNGSISLKQLNLKMSSTKWKPFCLSLNCWLSMVYLWIASGEVISHVIVVPANSYPFHHCWGCLRLFWGLNRFLSLHRTAIRVVLVGTWNSPDSNAWQCSQWMGVLLQLRTWMASH